MPATNERLTQPYSMVFKCMEWLRIKSVLERRLKELEWAKDIKQELNDFSRKEYYEILHILDRF